MQWLSTAVTFTTSIIFGMLARRSPKKNWDFVKTWPAFVLFIISGTLSQVEFAQQQYERNVPSCDWILNDEGVLACKPVVGGSSSAERPDVAFFRWVGSGLVSILIDAPFEFLGLALGMGSVRRALESP